MAHWSDEPSDALLEARVRHYSLTVYRETSTCRMVGGNTNAACVMIGEKAAEMIAQDHQWTLAGFVGESASRR